MKNCVTFSCKKISRIKQYLSLFKLEDKFKSELRKNQLKGLCTKINLMSRDGILLQIVSGNCLESLSNQDLYAGVQTNIIVMRKTSFWSVEVSFKPVQNNLNNNLDICF